MFRFFFLDLDREELELLLVPPLRAAVPVPGAWLRLRERLREREREREAFLFLFLGRPWRLFVPAPLVPEFPPPPVDEGLLPGVLDRLGRLVWLRRLLALFCLEPVPPLFLFLLDFFVEAPLDRPPVEFFVALGRLLGSRR